MSIHTQAQAQAQDQDQDQDQAQAPSPPAKRTEHNIETRSMALAFWLKGDSYRSIGKQLGLSHTTVQGIISKFQKTGSVKNQTRCGGPQKLQVEDIERLKNDVLEDRESRTMPLTGITVKFNTILTTKVSETTVRRVLKKQGIKSHAAAIKPFVSETNAAKRVAWCQERLNWEIKDWEKVCIYI